MFVYLYKADMYFASYDTLSVPQGLMYFYFAQGLLNFFCCNNIFAVFSTSPRKISRLFSVCIK